MPDWGDVAEGQRYQSIGQNLATTSGIQVNAGNSVKPATYTTIAAATAFGASGIYVNIVNSSPGRWLIDVAVGAAGSEVIVIPDIAYETPRTNERANQLFFPLSIAAGSRISARARGAAASTAVYMSVTIVGGALMQTFDTVLAYGITIGSTYGTSVDPGATANVKGAVTALLLRDAAGVLVGTGTVLRPISQFLVAVTTLGRGTGNANAGYLIDLALDGSNLVITDIPFRTGNTPDFPAQCFFGPYQLQIPVGVEWGARCQSSNATLSTRPIGISVYGVS